MAPGFTHLPELHQYAGQIVVELHEGLMRVKDKYAVKTHLVSFLQIPCYFLVLEIRSIKLLESLLPLLYCWIVLA